MKKFLSVICTLSVMFIPLLTMAEVVHCVVCGDSGWLKKDEQVPKDWGHYNAGCGKNSKSGYFCAKTSCTKVIQRWHKEDFIALDNISSEILNNAEKEKKVLKIIATLNKQLRNDLIAARTNKNVSKKQFVLLQRLIKKINVIDFWKTFVAYADLEAIKIFWPNSTDEKVYLNSKKHLEEVEEKEFKKIQNFHKRIVNARLKNDAREIERIKSQVTINPDGSVEFRGKINFATKNAPFAFALGISKKDNTVRFVEGNNFSMEIFSSVIENGRTDVLSYLIKQCGGLSKSLQSHLQIQWKKANAELTFNHFLLKREIKRVEKKKKTADDKFESKKYDDMLTRLNKKLKNEKTAVPHEICPLIFVEPDFLVFASILADNKYIRYACADKISQEDVFKIYSSLKSGDVDGVANALNIDKSLSQEEEAEVTQIYFNNLITQFDCIASKKNPEVSKWLKWRKDFLKNWKTSVTDPWLPMYLSGTEWNSWFFQEGYAYYKKPGYVSSSGGKFVWNQGTPDLTRPGYYADEKEGTFKWVPNSYNVSKIGFVSGDKAGEWIVAAGFSLKNGKAVWTKGMKDPKNPGLISGEKIFTWIPDPQHLWKDPKNQNNLEIEKDRKVLSPIGKLCLLPLVIILGIR